MGGSDKKILKALKANGKKVTFLFSFSRALLEPEDARACGQRHMDVTRSNGQRTHPLVFLFFLFEPRGCRAIAGRTHSHTETLGALVCAATKRCIAFSWLFFFFGILTS